MTYHSIIRRECGPETCPTIDRVQGRIGAALDAIDRAARMSEVPADAVDVLTEAKAAIFCEREVLEGVRETTGKLREALAERMERIEELEKERDAEAKRADRAEDRADTAEAEERALNDRIADLEAIG